MSEQTALLDQDSHFAFGKNWASYAALVSEAQIAEAMAGLRRLAGGELTGKRFLDIGSGSGIHALAALRLGASEVLAVDIDPDSVATTRRLLQAYASGNPWRVLESSVFSLDAAAIGHFDVVYSWGVLHHTGDMYRALRNAAALVAADGQFIFALYRHTRLCWFWKLEKRWYAKASERSQRRARSIFLAVVRQITRPARYDKYIAEYAMNSRGMDFNHDVHDWLGGWPYESISPTQVDRLMAELGMKQLRSFVYDGTSLGLLGSGCDEYAYARV